MAIPESTEVSEMRAHDLPDDMGLHQSTMSYYPTLQEDLARAKEILIKGQPSTWERSQFTPEVVEALRQVSGGTIYGADIYAAYMLLKSFVEEIEDYQHSFELYSKASMALMQLYKRAHPDAPEDTWPWPDATTVNVWAAAEIERLHGEAVRERLLGTVRGYAAGENAESKHWRQRAEAAEADAERERLARRAVDEALRQAVEKRDQLQEMVNTVGPKVCELALRHQRQADIGECICRTAGCGHRASSHTPAGDCRECGKNGCWY